MTQSGLHLKDHSHICAQAKFAAAAFQAKSGSAVMVLECCPHGGVWDAGKESSGQRQLLVLGPRNWVDGNTITDQGQI